MTKKLTKKELLAILVDDYGYEKDDIKMLTNAKLEAMIKQEEKDAQVMEEQETITQVTDDFVQIKDDDMVQVMSGVHGELVHRSGRTGRMWKFTKFGQVDRMPFIELVSIHNHNTRTLEECTLIILNNKVAENFGLTEVYKNIITPKNLDGLFEKSVDELEEIVKHLPHSMKLTFVSRAKELYTQKKLDSVRLINFIQDTFGFSLDDNAPTKELVF